LTHPCFELAAGTFEREKDVVDVWPRVMLARMPPLRALFKRFVIAVFVLLDNPFEADIATDLIAEVIELMQHEETGYPAIAVSEGMYAEEVQIKCSEQDKRMYPPLHDSTGS
jgi:hypothetical protein